MQSPIRLRVIVVNYRTPELALSAVASLSGMQRDSLMLEIVIVDNASGDESLAILTAGIQAECKHLPVRLIASEQNGGFASGNNLALSDFIGTDVQTGRERGSATPCDVVWLLNPDTYLLPNQDLTPLLSWMRERKNVGIVGTAVCDPDEQVRRTAFRFPTAISEIESGLRFGPISRLLGKYVVAPEVPLAACSVDWVEGSSLLIKAEVLAKVGLLDEGYFMYFEETDFCRAAALCGFETWYRPEIKVVHLVGQASGVTGSQRKHKRRPKYWFDSRKRYFTKNHGWVVYRTASIAWIFMYPFGRLWSLVRGRSVDDPPYLWWDFFRHHLNWMK